MTPAADLLARVERLGRPYGLERSAKLVDGTLLDGRFLVSLHRDALGPDPMAALAALTDAPAPVRDALEAALRGAEIVHLGHEDEDERATRKIYCEYVGEARAAMAAGRPVLVHLAHKWGLEGAHGVTRYVWRPCSSSGDARARIAERVSGPRARAVLLAAVDKVAAGPFDMLEVTEPDNPRSSLDLNLYDADLDVGQASDLIEAAGEAFGIARNRLADVFGPARATRLGHVAAGRDRRGREFATFYFGLEARDP